MMKFEENFEKVAKELEKLNQEWVIRGVSSNHKTWTPKNKMWLWSVPRKTAELLKFLVVTTKAKTILELGTSAGYSTIWLAWGAKINNGKVYTIELFKPKIKLAKKFFKKAKLENYIIQIHGDIHQELDKWRKQVDFVFIDADKYGYLTYTKKILPYLKKGGLIVADNAVSHAHLMHDFLTFVKTNKNLESRLLEMNNGILLATKK